MLNFISTRDIIKEASMMIISARGVKALSEGLSKTEPG